jgi:hypothetical protein
VGADESLRALLLPLPLLPLLLGLLLLSRPPLL